jgi:hypothetical protein
MNNPPELSTFSPHAGALAKKEKIASFGFLRISDNSIGMSYSDLQGALRVGRIPDNPTGRSKYGLGMKTAACWFGNVWTVRTKKLGETVEHL